MTNVVYLPQTPHGRVEFFIARKRRRPLAGVDWDAYGAQVYRDWLRMNGRKAVNGSNISPPDDAA
jgi:hypothetical protein